jgi:hypothetical protein
MITTPINIDFLAGLEAAVDLKSLDNVFECNSGFKIAHKSQPKLVFQHYWSLDIFSVFRFPPKTLWNFVHLCFCSPGNTLMLQWLPKTRSGIFIRNNMSTAKDYDALPIYLPSTNVLVIRLQMESL